jgi:hypothetical protein
MRLKVRFESPGLLRSLETGFCIWFEEITYLLRGSHGNFSCTSPSPIDEEAVGGENVFGIVILLEVMLILEIFLPTTKTSWFKFIPDLHDSGLCLILYS